MSPWCLTAQKAQVQDPVVLRDSLGTHMFENVHIHKHTHIKKIVIGIKAQIQVVHLTCNQRKSATIDFG